MTDENNLNNMNGKIKVLIVVTSVDHMDEKHKTGTTFEEFAVPYLDFVNEGYDVTVASPMGGKAPIDPASEHILEDIKWKKAKEVLNDTRKLDTVDYSDYDALVLPGGHGPMFDLAVSDTLGKIVTYFASNSKLIAAICHGPAGLLPAIADGNHFVTGRRLTCLTNEEEAIAKKTELVPFFLEDELKKQNAFFIEKNSGTINVVEHDNLITAQNRESTKTFANTIIKYLSR